MKELKKSRYVKIMLTIVVSFFGCLILWELFKSIDLLGAIDVIISILMPFFVGFAVAYLVNPIMVFFEKIFTKVLMAKKASKKLCRALSVFISILLSLFVITLLIVLIAPQIVLSVNSLINNMPYYLNNTTKFLDDFLHDGPISINDVDNFAENIKGVIIGYVQTVPSQIPNMIDKVSSSVFGILDLIKNVILGIIISFYVLYNKEKFMAQSKKVILAIFNRSFSKKILSLLSETHKVFGGFITGVLIDSFIIGIMCFIGISVLRMPYAALIAVIVGVTNVIPFFGPFIGAIPSAFIILMVDPIKVIWFVLFIIALQQFDGNILKPKILGSTTGLATFWVLFAILFGGGLFGFLGMFLGVPVFSIVYMLISKFLNRRLIKKRLPTDTFKYIDANSILDENGPGNK